jgi:hypothetical protein
MVSAVEKEGQLIRNIAKPLDMGDIAAGFDGKLELGGSGLPPTLEHLRGG